MATTSERKKLVELRVLELRTELEKRGLEKTGAKNALIERLKKAVVSEGIDPGTFEFEVACTPVRGSASGAVQRQARSNRAGSEKMGTDEDVEGSSGGDGEEKSELNKVENEKTDDELLELNGAAVAGDLGSADFPLDITEDDEEELLSDKKWESAVSDIDKEADESLALDPPPVEPAPASTTSTLMEEGGDEEEAAPEEEKNGLKEEKNGLKDEEDCLVMNSTTGVAAPAVVAGDMKNEEDLSVLVLIDDQQNDLDADIIGVAATAAAAVPVTEEATGSKTQVVVQEIAPVASTPTGSDKTPTTVKKIATATPVAGQAKIKIEGQEKNAVSLQQGATSGVKPAINTKTSTGAPATVTAAKTPATTNTGAATTTTARNLASAAVNSTATVTEKSKSSPAVSQQTGPATSKATDGQDESSRSKSASTASRNLWVSGLSAATRAADLKTLFSKHGKVTGAKVVTNAKSPGAKCYGFVTMATTEEASKCIQHLHRTELQGKMISVERAKADPSSHSAPSPAIGPKKKKVPTATLR